MVSYQKLYDLEDEYHAQKRLLEQAADTLDDLYNQFRIRTDSYIDQVFDAFQGLEDISERNRSVNQIQDIIERYHHDYVHERDRLEDKKIALKRQFDNDYEEAYEHILRQKAKEEEEG